jgi:hypothetical protein
MPHIPDTRMSEDSKTLILTIRPRLGRLKMALRKIDFQFTSMFCAPWNVERKTDRRRLVRLGEHMEVLEALVIDDALDEDGIFVGEEQWKPGWDGARSKRTSENQERMAQRRYEVRSRWRNAPPLTAWHARKFGLVNHPEVLDAIADD